jgi:hypothetical protein
MIGIIVPANIKYAPYVQNYLKILKQRKINYKIMSWDRTGLEEKSSSRTYKIQHFVQGLHKKEKD